MTTLRVKDLDLGDSRLVMIMRLAIVGAVLLALAAVAGCDLRGGAGEYCNRNGTCDYGLTCAKTRGVFESDDFRCAPTPKTPAANHGE